LVQLVFKQFRKIPDPRNARKDREITLTDHLMSGLAIFGMKCPSLLDYDRKRSDVATAQNLRDLYHVGQAPSDTYLRERLDEVNPDSLRRAFTKVFAAFQRGNGLEGYEFMKGHVLISLDGTGFFSSSEVSCPHCCVKKHANGTESYYHQMLGACVVHPNKRNVIPLCPEVILNRDGATKNDCERNATYRFVKNFRREHPFLKAIFIADGLSSSAPTVRLLRENSLSYILGAKPGDHQYLFEQLESDEGTVYHEITTKDGHYHQYRFLNGAMLNKSNQDVRVNVLEYRDTNPKGRESSFSWITNISLSTNSVQEIAEGGRARWKIENETFNTLKNLGYNLEHNYGHGKKYLSTVFCMLMMLAFLIDQIQEACCQLFQRCKQRAGSYRELWVSMRSLFKLLPLRSWENFYSVLAGDRQLNTS